MTPLYSQVFDQSDTRWLSHGQYYVSAGNEPLASAVFGAQQANPELDWRETLRGTSLSAIIFGSTDYLSQIINIPWEGTVMGLIFGSNLADFLATGPGSLLDVITGLEDRIATLESQLNNHAARLSALEN